MEMLRKGWNWKPSLLRWEEHVWERHLNAVLWACPVKICINLESNVAKGMAAAAALAALSWGPYFSDTLKKATHFRGCWSLGDRSAASFKVTSAL